MQFEVENKKLAQGAANFAVLPTAGFCHLAHLMAQWPSGWRSGLVVERRTCDLVVVGSRPGRDAAAQQP